MSDNEIIARFQFPNIDKEIEEDDFKIEAFMLTKIAYWQGDFDKLKYKSSWNHLMVIVERIESIRSNHHGAFGVHISSNSCSIQGTNLHLAIQDLEGYGHVYCDEVVLDTKLESTYQACLNFINWHNKQNKDEN